METRLQVISERRPQNYVSTHKRFVVESGKTERISLEIPAWPSGDLPTSSGRHSNLVRRRLNRNSTG
jgi:hypothetical protein